MKIQRTMDFEGNSHGSNANDLITVMKIALPIEDQTFSHQLPLYSILMQRRLTTPQDDTDVKLSKHVKLCTIQQLNYMICMNFHNEVKTHSYDDDAVQKWMLDISNKWTVGGVCLTSPDPRGMYDGISGLERHLTVSLRGRCNAENIWGCGIKPFDKCQIVLKMADLVNFEAKFVVGDGFVENKINFSRLTVRDSSGNNVPVTKIPQFVAVLDYTPENFFDGLMVDRPILIGYASKKCHFELGRPEFPLVPQVMDKVMNSIPLNLFIN